MKAYRMKLNGKVFEIEVEELAAGQVVQQSAPAPAAPVAQPKLQEVKAAPTGGGEEISAPMPGTILDIKVNEGQGVRLEMLLLFLRQ